MKKFVTTVLVLCVSVLIAFPWPVHHSFGTLDVVDTLYKHDTIYIIRDTVFIDLTKQPKIYVL